MSIRDVVAQVVEEVIAGVNLAADRGLDVFQPKTIDVEVTTDAGAVVRICVPVAATARVAKAAGEVQP